MADFCKQCSIDMYGEDYGDLSNITQPEYEAKQMYVCVLCEGCGPCQVKCDGTCISKDCLKCHGK